MNFKEVHLAVRALVQAAGKTKFSLSIQSTELHPGRCEVRWKVFVSGRIRGQALYFESSDPGLLLAWVARALKEQPTTTDLALEPVGDPGEEPLL